MRSGILPPPQQLMLCSGPRKSIWGCVWLMFQRCVLVCTYRYRVNGKKGHGKINSLLLNKHEKNSYEGPEVQHRPDTRYVSHPSRKA